MAKMNPIPKKSLERKIKEEELTLYEKAEQKAVKVDVISTGDLIRKLSKEEKEMLNTWMFSGGKEGYNPLEQLRKEL